MTEETEAEGDQLSEIWLSEWEEECIEHIESEQDYDSQFQSERDAGHQKLWSSFQHAASSVTQLYKGHLHGTSVWIPFQAAAGTVTTLYKDATDAVIKYSDLGIQCGTQRKVKEILSWARKKRRFIRREDLISYLAGKQRSRSYVRSQPRSSPRRRLMFERRSSPNVDVHHRHEMQHRHDIHHWHDRHHLNSNNIGIVDETSIREFREALTHSPMTMHRIYRSGELGAFITNEYARYSKRPLSYSPSHDVSMESPTHKRSRLM